MRPTDGQKTPENEERREVLAQLEDWLEAPMLILSVAWFCLVLVELVWRTSQVFDVFGTAIWVIFLGEFLLRLALAPEKLVFLRSNPLTLLALIAPAFRFFRFARLLNLSRSFRLVRVIGTANRSINALRKTLRRRGLGYLLGATFVIVIIGAGGMLAFEARPGVENGFAHYGDALWWTAMLVATTGTDFWPQTPEGRILSLLLSFYGLAVFGYITASFASFFIGREASEIDSGLAGSREVTELQHEIALLRTHLEGLRASNTS